MNTLIKIIIVSLLTTCVSKKKSVDNTNSPIEQTSFVGVLRTCILDSSSLTKEKRIQIISYKAIGSNPVCGDNPVDYHDIKNIRTDLSINFQVKGYYFQFPDPKERHSIARKGTGAISKDFGDLTYDVKKSVLTLSSVSHKWTRTFNFHFSQDKDTLILIALD